MKSFRFLLLLCIPILAGLSIAQTDGVSSPSANAERIQKQFEEKYLAVLRNALGSEAGGAGAEFWENAYQIVFGVRVNDAQGARAARDIFESAKTWPRVRYMPITPENPIYLPGPQGDRMEEELNQALADFEAKAHHTQADYAAVITKMAPFIRTIMADDMMREGGVEVPAGTVLTYEAPAYCLQHNLPAPSSGDDMWLIPASTLIPPGAREIFEALLRYSEGHPNDHSIIQSLLWAIREANEHPYTKISADQRRVLDASLKDGANKFLAFMGVKVDQPKSAKPTVSRRPTPPASDPYGDPYGSTSTDGASDDSSDPYGRPASTPPSTPRNQGGALDSSALKRQIAQKNKENAGIIEHGMDPCDPGQVEAIMRRLNDPALKKNRGDNPPTPNDGFTQLAPNVAAKTTTRNGKNITEVANGSNKDFWFRPESYIALTRQNRQPFAFTAPGQLPTPEEMAQAVAKAKEIVAKSKLVLHGKYDPNYHAQNRIWDILQHDSDGNPICDVIDYWPLDGTTVNKRGVRVRDTDRPIPTVLAIVNLYDRNGVPITAAWNVYDALEWDSDCHGYSLTGGQFFIDNGQIQQFLDGVTTDKKRVNKTSLLKKGNTFPANNLGDAPKGSLVVLRKADNTVVHSFISLGEGKIREAAGTVVYDSTGQSVSRPNTATGWTNEAGQNAIGALGKTHDTTLAKAVESWTARNPGLTVEVWTPTQ